MNGRFAVCFRYAFGYFGEWASLETLKDYRILDGAIWLVQVHSGGTVEAHGGIDMPYLTKQIVQELSPTETAYKVSDAPGTKGLGVVGLCVRVTPSGHKTFALQYRTPQKGKGWLKIGRFGDITLEEARTIARKHKLTLANGVDPAALIREAAEAGIPINDLAEKFIKEDLPVNYKESTAYEYERLISYTILPAIGHWTVRTVGTGDIATFLSGLREKTPTQSNRVRAVLSKMFSKAELWEMRDIGTNPVRGQDKVLESPRDRRLSTQEIQALGRMLRDMDASALKPWKERTKEDPSPESHIVRAALRLDLLTGFRLGELLALRWEWVDLERGIVTIPAPDHKTGRKTGKARIVYLCSAAVAILKILDQKKPAKNPYVLIGETAGQPWVNLQAPWGRIRKAVSKRAAEEVEKSKDKAPALSITDVHIHDLRRTFSSVGADMGFPELFIKTLLGHGVRTVTQIYTRLSHDPLKEAAEEIGKTIAGWLAG